MRLPTTTLSAAAVAMLSLAAPAHAGMAKHCAKNADAWEARYNSRLVDPIEHIGAGVSLAKVRWANGEVHGLVLRRTDRGYCAVAVLR